MYFYTLHLHVVKTLEQHPYVRKVFKDPGDDKSEIKWGSHKIYSRQTHVPLVSGIFPTVHLTFTEVKKTPSKSYLVLVFVYCFCWNYKDQKTPKN